MCCLITKFLIGRRCFFPPKPVYCSIFLKHFRRAAISQTLETPCSIHKMNSSDFTFGRCICITHQHIILPLPLEAPVLKALSSLMCLMCGCDLCLKFCFNKTWINKLACLADWSQIILSDSVKPIFSQPCFFSLRVGKRTEVSFTRGSQFPKAWHQCTFSIFNDWKN